MNVFFDVDDTLLAFDGVLRPGAHEVFEKLVDNGHRVYVWSGVGVRTRDIERVGLRRLVTGIYKKPLFKYSSRLKAFGVPVTPEFVVDDYPGIVEHFGGLRIKPYESGRSPDDELSIIPDLVETLACCGDDPTAQLKKYRFVPDPSSGNRAAWQCRCAVSCCTIYWALGAGSRADP